MVEYFLPNMRGLVAHELREKGLGQRKIASLLGVTQARVSNYLSKSKRRYSQELSKRFGANAAEIESYSRILAQDVSKSQVDGIFTLYSVWKNLLFEGKVCSLHQMQSGITSECSVCMELHKPQRESQEKPATEDSSILRDISNAIATLENSATFPLLMPEVSVNVAMARPSPKTVRDVAAIPGRLNKIHGRAKAFVPPEFGCSNHMSNVILIFNSKSNVLRSAMNLRFDSSIQSALSELGMATLFTSEMTSSSEDGSYRRETDPVLSRLSSVSLPDTELASFSVVDRGSAGVEPNTYLVGRTASELAQIAVKISYNCVTALRSTARKV